MRRLVLGLAAAMAFAAGSGSALAHPPGQGPPLHLHCLETPSGKTHAIAPGVTFHAAHVAFDNFHFNVHRGVFGVEGGPMPVEGKHPLGPLPLTFGPTC